MPTNPMRWPIRWLSIVLLCLIVASVSPANAQGPEGIAPIMGVVHINSSESPQSGARLQRGVETGASFDRFPLYWNSVERTEGRFDWGRADRALQDNEAAGLDTLLILLGTAEPHYPSGIPPLTNLELLRADGVTDAAELYVDAQRCTESVGRPPIGLDQPIFADGSDQPAPGKAINPANPWASYVHLVATRYTPGGIAGTSVSHWEIWNEPDLCQFWSGTPREYARLLKSAYLVIKQVDPNATVMWGGLAHFEQPEFLPAMVYALQSEPNNESNAGFFDAAASHQYSDVTKGYVHLQRIRNAISGTGWGEKPIWITESGVPVCGDEVGPQCPDSHRADSDGQAAYIWQNLAYSRLVGAASLFHFQLFDDCGNDHRPAPPADAFGLVTNEGTARCVPHRAEQRASYSAFQLAAAYLATGELIDSQAVEGDIRTFTFYDRASGEQRTLLFTMSTSGAIVDLAANSEEAFTLRPDGSRETLSAENGSYRLTLEGSSNPKQPGSATFIGGTPVLLVEQVGPVEVAPLPVPEPEEEPPLVVVESSPPSEASPPLAEEGFDRTPPSVYLEIVPYDDTLFELAWYVEDESGIPERGVELWIQVDGSEWFPYLIGQEATGGTFIEGEPGVTYRFGAYAIDWFGNASDLDPDAVVEITMGDARTGR